MDAILYFSNSGGNFKESRVKSFDAIAVVAAAERYATAKRPSQLNVPSLQWLTSDIYTVKTDRHTDMIQRSKSQC